MAATSPAANKQTPLSQLGNEYFNRFNVNSRGHKLKFLTSVARLYAILAKKSSFDRMQELKFL